jgi:hypothetical protein
MEAAFFEGINRQRLHETDEMGAIEAGTCSVPIMEDGVARWGQDDEAWLTPAWPILCRELFSHVCG